MSVRVAEGATPIGDGQVRVVYGPFVLEGEISLDVSSGLTIEGIPSNTFSLVPDGDGDGAPEVLYACAERLVRLSLRERGHIRDGCAAGWGLVGSVSPYDSNALMYARWFGGGDFDGDGIADVVLTELTDHGEEGWLPENFHVWLGAPHGYI